MLDVTPENLREEILRAEDLRDKYINARDALIRGYVGSHFREGTTGDQPHPENHAFEYISLMLPLLAYDNPAVTVSSRKITTGDDITIGMEDALNQWVGQVNLQAVLELLAVDMLFGRGIACMAFEQIGSPNDPDVPPIMQPRLYYIDSRRFFIDPLAVCNLLGHGGYDGVRFMGHRWVRDKKDLLDNPKFDRKAVESISPDAELETLGRPSDEDGGSPASDPTRGEIVGWEIWIPPATIDPRAKFNGTIYTLAASIDAKGKIGQHIGFIRKPRPFYGPWFGPYINFGVYPVPGHTQPLAPLVGTAEQVEELNAHANAAARAAAREKSIVLINSSEDAAKKAVKDSKDGEVWGVPNLNPNSVQQLEIGGVAPQRIEYLQLLMDRRDRQTGINDAQRGNVKGDVLATEINTANASSTLRNSYIRKKFTQGVVQILTSAAWYIYNSPNFVTELSPQAAERLGMAYPVLLGGQHPENQRQAFTDLALNVEPYSMERPNEAALQAKTMQLLEWLLQLLPLMPQIPFVDFKAMLDQVGRAFNYRELSRFVDEEKLEALRQAMQQAQAAQAQKPPSISMSYKDMPPDVARQLEALVGFQPSQIGLSAQQMLDASNAEADRGQRQQQADMQRTEKATDRALAAAESED